MNTESNPVGWSIKIPALDKGVGGAAIFGWVVLLVLAFWADSTPGMIQNHTVIVVGGGLFALAIVATGNAYLIRSGKRGGLSLDKDGIAIQRGWRADAQFAWGDVAKFDTLLISPNDGSSRFQAGFYWKSPNGSAGTFVNFPETLGLPNDQLVSVLEYVRSMPAERRESLPRDMSSLVRLAQSAKREHAESNCK